MRYKEFRIIMPMTVDEYRIGQLYGVRDFFYHCYRFWIHLVVFIVVSFFVGVGGL